MKDFLLVETMDYGLAVQTVDSMVGASVAVLVEESDCFSVVHLVD
jgi:hypothetical protein